MKKIVKLTVFMGILFLLVPQSTMAQNTTSTRPSLKTLRTIASNSADMKNVASKITTTRKQRVLTEIDRRIMLLNEASKKVDGLTHITTTEKSTLQATINTALTNLSTLKTNINGSNNEASLATDIQTLITTHKNFSIALPQVRLLITAELMDSLANKMLEVVKKIEIRVTALHAAGKDTSSISTQILNLKAELANVKAQSNSITATVIPLASDSDSSKAILKTAQAKLKTSMQDLRSASQDLKEILKDLKESASEDPLTGTPSAQ